MFFLVSFVSIYATQTQRRRTGTREPRVARGSHPLPRQDKGAGFIRLVHSSEESFRFRVDEA